MTVRQYNPFKSRSIPNRFTAFFANFFLLPALLVPLLVITRQFLWQRTVGQQW